MPPAVDVEFHGNYANRPSIAIIRAELSDFLRRVEAAYGRAAIIYATRDTYSEILSGQFPDHAIWSRDVFFEPRLDDGRKWTVWQYMDRGRLAGIRTLVGLTVFHRGDDVFHLCANMGYCG